MAATSGKNKVRLDYSALIDEAISENKTEENTEIPEKAAAELIKKAPVRQGKNVTDTEKTKKEKEKATPPVKHKEEKEPVLDSLDAKFSIKQKGRGVQKSVYLEEDVFEFIQSKCDRYNIKFSQVLNEMLRDAINGYKK